MFVDGSSGSSNCCRGVYSFGVVVVVACHCCSFGLMPIAGVVSLCLLGRGCSGLWFCSCGVRGSGVCAGGPECCR